MSEFCQKYFRHIFLVFSLIHCVQIAAVDVNYT